MKKILLSLVGVVGMTAGNIWGQSTLSAGSPLPQSFNIQGLSNMRNFYDAQESNPNGPYYFQSYKTNSYGPFYIVQAIYTNATGWKIGANDYDSTKKVNTDYTGPIDSHVGFIPPDHNSAVAVVIGPGLLGDVLTNSSPVFTPNEGWAGYSFNGAVISPVNGGNDSGNGDIATGGVIAQAEQLNIGLEFINGQWTVKQ